MVYGTSEMPALPNRTCCCELLMLYTTCAVLEVEVRLIACSMELLIVVLYFDSM